MASDKAPYRNLTKMMSVSASGLRKDLKNVPDLPQLKDEGYGTTWRLTVKNSFLSVERQEESKLRSPLSKSAPEFTFSYDMLLAQSQNAQTNQPQTSLSSNPTTTPTRDDIRHSVLTQSNEEIDNLLSQALPNEDDTDYTDDVEEPAYEAFEDSQFRFEQPSVAQNVYANPGEPAAANFVAVAGYGNYAFVQPTQPLNYYTPASPPQPQIQPQAHPQPHPQPPSQPQPQSHSQQKHSGFHLSIRDIASGADTRTTLMIKNIPNKYTQQMLLETLRAYKGQFDFFYLPIDFKNKCNVGYAFVNFLKHEYIISLFQQFHGQSWEKFNSMKVCEITYARIQGKNAMIEHFRNSRLLIENRECRPLIFQSNGARAGDEEEFPIGPNYPYTKGFTTNTSWNAKEEYATRPNRKYNKQHAVDKPMMFNHATSWNRRKPAMA